MFNLIYISATLSNQLAYIRFIHVHSKATNETTTAGRPRSYIFNPAINQSKKNKNNKNKKDSQKIYKQNIYVNSFTPKPCKNSHLQNTKGGVF